MKKSRAASPKPLSPAKKANPKIWTLLTEAWGLVSRERSLWWLGLIAGLGQGYGLNPQLFGRFDSRFDPRAWQVSLPELSSFTSLLIVLFLIILAVWLLSLVAEAGLMKSVVKATTRQKMTFRSGFTSGRPYLWAFVKVQLLFGALALVVALIIGLPALALVYQSSGLKMVTGGAGLVLFVLFGLLLACLTPWIFRFIVLKDVRILAAIRATWRLFRSQPWPLLAVSFIGLLVHFLATLLILASFLIILVPILLLAVLLFKNAIGSLFVGATTVVLGTVTIFLLGGLAAWKNAYYTLAFQRVNA